MNVASGIVVVGVDFTVGVIAGAAALAALGVVGVVIAVVAIVLAIFGIVVGVIQRSMSKVRSCHWFSVGNYFFSKLLNSNFEKY